MKGTLTLVAAIAAAIVCGRLAQRFSVPGGLILGGMIGSGAVTLLARVPPVMPQGARELIFIGVGASIGMSVSRETVLGLRDHFVPAVLAAVLLIVAGLGIALLLRELGMAPVGDALATSPGALSVLTAASADLGRGPVEVALFHTVRVVLVILSLPLLVKVLEG